MKLISLSKKELGERAGYNGQWIAATLGTQKRKWNALHIASKLIFPKKVLIDVIFSANMVTLQVAKLVLMDLMSKLATKYISTLPEQFINVVHAAHAYLRTNGSIDDLRQAVRASYPGNELFGGSVGIPGTDEAAWKIQMGGTLLRRDDGRSEFGVTTTDGNPVHDTADNLVVLIGIELKYTDEQYQDWILSRVREYLVKGEKNVAPMFVPLKVSRNRTS